MGHSGFIFIIVEFEVTESVARVRRLWKLVKVVLQVNSLLPEGVE
jgi:hypothetical protein